MRLSLFLGNCCVVRNSNKNFPALHPVESNSLVKIGGKVDGYADDLLIVIRDQFLDTLMEIARRYLRTNILGYDNRTTGYPEEN